ncbi:heme biosynthesis HemY N-terminal domain-containing protein [Pseudoalteromonas sp. T1lg65]|uniref:heme biosynthesis HemY N-terminal domain-containing protein n=1 Tax=Pseudoalteromonas sp. T1lg65 TaxID=2077101 RepID=UPI003F7A85F3
MIAKILTFVIILVALAAGHLLIDEKGYVLIAFNQTTIEGTIVAFVIMLFLLFVVTALVWKATKWLWRSYVSTKGHFSRKRQLRADAAWHDALWSLLNDDVTQAHARLAQVKQPESRDDFVKAIKAKAALQRGDNTLACTELETISAPNQSQLSTLWLQVNNGEQALTLLDDKMAQKKPAESVIASYIRAQVQSEQPEAAVETVIKWHKKLSWNDAQWQELFTTIFSSPKAPADALFDRLPKVLKSQVHPALLNAKLANGKLAEVADELKKLLKKGQYHQLSDYLSHTVNSDNDLKMAVQQQLKKQPEQPDLLFALACLSNAEGDHALAAKIFDSLSAHQSWQDRWSQQAQLAYEKTAEFEKAYLIAKS